MKINTNDENDTWLPPDSSDEFISIEMDLFAGRSPETKNHLLELIPKRLAALGYDKKDIKILLREHPIQHWGLQGTSADRLDLGFEISV